MNIFVVHLPTDHTAEAGHRVQKHFAHNRSTSKLALRAHNNFWCNVCSTDPQYTATITRGEMIHTVLIYFHLGRFDQQHRQHVNITLVVAYPPAARTPLSIKHQQQQHLHWLHLHEKVFFIAIFSATRAPTTVGTTTAVLAT